MNNKYNRSLLRQLQNFLFGKAKKKSPFLAILVVLAFALAFYFLNEYESKQPPVGKDSPQYEEVEKPKKEKEIVQSADDESLLNLKWDGTMQNIAVPVNNNRSTFTDSDLKEDGNEDFWVKFSKRDKLGRAQEANAKLSRDTYMKVKSIQRPRIPQGNDPVGWRYKGKSNNGQIYFDGENQALYNRSHLIAWMFIADAGSMENLVTGTRAFNNPGMNYYEGKISNALYYGKTHIRYRVTPIYSGNELLPRGVQMMAKSIEDNGKTYDLNVYVFNVQPGVEIDYLTGQNSVQEK